VSKISQGRREDRRLITGEGKYTADWNLPGQLYSWFLRSDRAHAEIISIRTEQALAVPGVIKILTGTDIVRENFKAPPVLAPMKSRDGTTFRAPHRHMLAVDRVRFVGEPVALVVAETQGAAQDGVEALAVEYNDLPVLVTTAQAAAPDAQQLYADIPGNLALDYEYGAQGPTDAALKDAAHVVTVTLDAQRIIGNPMEPKACLASYDPTTEIFDLYLPTQGMGELVAGFTHITGLSADKFRIHACDVGGGFGVRNEVYPEFGALLAATRQLGRAVKWNGVRTETMMSDHHGRGATLRGSLALDAKGKFLGLKIDWLVDLGAFGSNAGAFVNTAASPTQSAIGAYRIPCVYGNHKLVFTNTTPTTAYRGAARPNVTYLIERLVDEAARVTGIDRIALRRRNLIPAGAFPFKTPTGSTYDSGHPAALLDKVLQEADWDGFERRRKAANKAGKRRGIGCAVFFEPSGGGLNEEIAIELDSTGSFNLYTVSGASGQGHETVFPQIVADILGVGPEHINLRASDPNGPRLVGHGTFGSRSLINHGGGLALGAREIVEKAKSLAAKDLEVAEIDLVFEQGRYSVPGTDISVMLRDIALKYANAPDHPLDTTLKINAMMAYPSGAHVCEVEIDPDTGTLQLLRYVAVDDFGKVYNHTIVEGQVHGGLMQGIGQMLGEHCQYESGSGQLITATFMDYYMPRARVLPALALFDVPTLSPTNTLGAKGAGEAGATGAVPTIANAVIDALKPLGISHVDAPFTAHRLWAVMHERGNEQ
jgi:aerobic carbon-monoxide dehydrogenase large subunit